MSTLIVCPYCGHSPPPNRDRLRVAVHCERCQKVFTPPTATAPPEPLVQPEMVFGSRSVPDVDVPSNASAFFAIFLIVGCIVLLCGGIGGYIAINARKRVVAAAQNVEELNQQRQRELEREAKPLPKPKPPPTRSVQKQVPQPPPVRSPPPIPPIEITPPVVPPIPLPVPADPPKRQPRPSPAGKSLDDLLADLNDQSNKRPAWVTLQELARLPVQEDRKVDVSSALDQHLRSSDRSTANAAAKAAVVWGTEWNGEALLSLIDSSNALVRWDAMRALAKIRPTAETAELLLAQAVNGSNNSALRDALKDLGPVGERAMFDYLESDDRELKQAMLQLISEVGGKSAVEPLEKMIRTETDIALKSQAEFTLQRIRSRQP
jgi:hypothetical protein